MFIVIRLVGILALITVGASLLVYLYTRDRRYLRLAGQVIRYGAVVVAVLLLLFLVERL